MASAWQQGPGLGHQRAQLLHREVIAVTIPRADAEQLQQTVREDRDQPDERCQQLRQRVIDERGRERDALRVQRGERLRRDLGEDQDDQCEHEATDRDPQRPAQPECDQRDELRRENVHEIVA